MEIQLYKGNNSRGEFIYGNLVIHEGCLHIVPMKNAYCGVAEAWGHFKGLNSYPVTNVTKWKKITI